MLSDVSPGPLRSGGLSLSFPPAGTAPYVLTVGGDEALLPPIAGAPLSAFVGGVARTVANGGLTCEAAASMAPGVDIFGAFSAAVEFRCVAKGSGATPSGTPVVFSWRAYSGSGGGGALEAGEGRIMASVAFPHGANGTAADGQGMLAPLPAWVVTDDAPAHGGANNSSPSSGLASAGILCYGGDKAHVYSRGAADGGIASAIQKDGISASCFGLGGGPATALWPGSRSSGGTGLSALVQGPASAFHLAMHRVYVEGKTPPPAPGPAGDVPAAVYFNEKRGDALLCLSENCARVQVASGYTKLFDEGYGPAPGGQPMYVTPLFFSWSAAASDNWVTASAAQPGSTYANFGNSDGAAWKDGGNGRSALLAYAKDEGGGNAHHFAAATNASKAWALANGYVATGEILGYLDAPVPTPPPTPAPPPTPSPVLWGFGLGGEVASLPAGFAQETLLTHSDRGVSAAWDAWGSALRRAHNTTKLADADPFVAALTIFTDNGAATLGAGWAPADPNPALQPAYDNLGDSVGFGKHNWSMVGTDVLSSVAAEARGKAVPGRGLQLDRWWYPVLKSEEKFWCASDWVQPEMHYPNGTGGVRRATQMPLMLYLPAACPTSIWSVPGKWHTNYSWADPSHAAGSYSLVLLLEIGLTYPPGRTRRARQVSSSRRPRTPHGSGAIFSTTGFSSRRGAWSRGRTRGRAFGCRPWCARDGAGRISLPTRQISTTTSCSPRRASGRTWARARRFLPASMRRARRVT